MVGQALSAQTRELTDRWVTQARTVALLELVEPGNEGDPGEGGDLSRAEGLVDALIAVLVRDEDRVEDVVARGLTFGADAFARSASLHHTMKALDLLLAMTMYAAESAASAADAPGGSAMRGVGAADGLRLARRLQQRAALLSLAATRGYTQAYADALRERFRQLRHDLRNPLGTIKNVLALLEDESIPLDARANPSFRGMAKRNARSLEELIADRLSDAAALLPVLAPQDVSLRSIACGVRRDLRATIDRHGATVLVGDEGPHGLLDATGLELLLRDVLLVALQECQPGDQFHLEFAERAASRATVALSLESGRPPISDAGALERLGSVAARIGATLEAVGTVIVSVPMRTGAGDPSTQKPSPLDRAMERAAERPVARETTARETAAREAVALGGGEPRHDLGGPREREHGESGAL